MKSRRSDQSDQAGMRTAPETDCEHAVYFRYCMVNYATMPMTVEVGGATIFVINVDHYEKI